MSVGGDGQAIHLAAVPEQPYPQSGGGTFAIVADPEDNHIGLFQK